MKLSMCSISSLPLVRRRLEREAFLAQHQVARIATDVFGEAAARHFDRAPGHAVEKIAVMRDEDDAALVRDQVILEPVARLDVEMVGRLVEHHEVGRVEQEFRERDAHPDAAGEFGDVAREVFVGEAQPEQHRGGAALGAVEVMMLELGQHLAQFLERGVVRGAGMLVGENLLDFLAPEIERLHPVERRQRLAQHRPAAHLGRVLGQVADAGALRTGDSARVERQHFGDHLEQRRFAGAVEPDQADAAVVAHRPADAVEDLAASVGLGEVVETKHGEKSHLISAVCVLKVTSASHAV
jgi:hypothetical protein